MSLSALRDRQRLFPFLALLAYLGLDFLRPHDVFVGLRTSRPMLILALLALAATLWQRRGHLFEGATLFVPLLALGITAALSTLGSIDPAASARVLLEVGKMLILVWLLVSLVDTERRFAAVLWVITMALGVLAVFTIVQGVDRGLMYRFDNDLIVQGPQGNQDGPLRDSNNLARVLALALPLWWVLAAAHRQAAGRMLAGAGLVITVMAIEFTYSRSGFVAMMAGAALVALSYRPLVRGLAVLMGFVIALLVLSPKPYLAHVGTLTDPLAVRSLQVRLQVWQGAYERIRRHLLRGEGAGTFESVQNDPAAARPRSSHNIFIEMATEMGVIGLAAYVWVLLAALYGLHQMRRRAEAYHRQRLRAASVGLQAALLAYLTASLALSSPFQSPPFVIIGLSLALRRHASLN